MLFRRKGKKKAAAAVVVSNNDFHVAPDDFYVAPDDFYIAPEPEEEKVEELEGYERYREFMDNLAENNVNEYVDLPMIAVMGDTSSGKSSLLSNISMVELPSSDVLTTRCPIMLQMHHAPKRWARVKVLWKNNEMRAHFPPRVVDEENWDYLTSFIAEAQSHIINTSGKEVERDIVSVEMGGPHCENLTLVDLPGIVRSAGRGESATLAEDIHGLINEYLKNPRCVILAVLPSNVDFHNSQIMAEARKADPDTMRTIPVLTKPDLIDVGAESSVKDLLLGLKTDKFKLGFHMVKGRGQGALNKKETIQKGLEREEEFFRAKEPWKSIEDKRLLGTKNLRVKLARLQIQLVQSSFKTIITEMKEHRERAGASLKALGVIPSTLSEKQALFRGIKEDIFLKNMDGAVGEMFAIGFHSACKRFQFTLQSSNLAKISDIAVGTSVIALLDGKEIKDVVSFIDDENKHVYLSEAIACKNATIADESRTGELGNIICTADGVFIERSDGAVDQLKAIERNIVRSDPQWIHDLIAQHRPLKFPGFLNPSLLEKVVKDLVGNEWAQPSLALLDATSQLTEANAERLIEGMDSAKSFPDLSSFLISKSSEAVELLKDEMRVNIEEFIEWERAMHTHSLPENVAKLRTERLMEEVLASVPADVEMLTKSTIKTAFERYQARPFDDKLAEEMQNALDAYGKVAVEHFVDQVPKMCLQIMNKFPKKMNEILVNVNDDDIERLVAAPPERAVTMAQLQREIEILDKGIATIRGLS